LPNEPEADEEEGMDEPENEEEEKVMRIAPSLSSISPSAQRRQLLSYFLSKRFVQLCW